MRSTPPYNYVTKIQGSLVFVDKIHGLATHARESSAVEGMGLVEILSEQLETSLDVVHRLDQVTSGAMVFSSDKQTTQQLFELFQNHQVKKIYVFLTDRKSSKTTFQHESFISKERGRWVSSRQGEHSNLAITQFQKIKNVGELELWRATPTTGKPHQIRLHAQDLKIPILGDLEHGGSPSYRTFLHSLSLEFSLKNETFHFQTLEPAWMQHPPSHCFLKDCIADRENIFGKVPSSECLRWVHHEGPQFRMDQFGEVLWVYWYSENEPTIQERQQLNEFAQQRNLKIEIRMMFNRGGPIRPTSPSIESTIPEKWIAAENQTRYEFRRDQGLSPGLFLDQRYNRYWVRKNATDKSVLNLFAYTGGFSVNAALGKAKEVCTVDLSKNFIEWSKINFQLNGLDSQRFEFRVSDCLGFLRSLSKKDRKFDLIIVDPPSFSRSKDGVFRIEKDWKSLLDLALSCLTQKGEILFSTNFEKMNTAEWARVLRTWAMSHKKDIMEMPSSLDCDRPGRRNESLLKSFLIR